MIVRFAHIACPDVRGIVHYVLSIGVMHVRDHLGACFAVARVHHDINCCYVMFLCHVLSFSSFVRMMQMTCPRVRLAMLYVLYVLGSMIDLFFPCYHRCKVPCGHDVVSLVTKCHLVELVAIVVFTSMMHACVFRDHLHVYFDEVLTLFPCLVSR